MNEFFNLDTDYSLHTFNIHVSGYLHTVDNGDKQCCRCNVIYTYSRKYSAIRSAYLAALGWFQLQFLPASKLLAHRHHAAQRWHSCHINRCDYHGWHSGSRLHSRDILVRQSRREDVSARKRRRQSRSRGVLHRRARQQRRRRRDRRRGDGEHELLLRGHPEGAAGPVQLAAAARLHPELRPQGRLRRLRRGVQGPVPERRGGGREGAQQHAGQARRGAVHGGGRHHRPDLPHQPRQALRLLLRRRGEGARVRVHGERVAGRVPVRPAAGEEGRVRQAARDRRRDGEGAAVPARGVRAADHPLRHQAGERAPRRGAGAQGVRLRAGEAVRQGGHPPDHHRRAGHARVRGAGALDAAPRDAQVRRLQLRDADVRDAREAPEPGAGVARPREPGMVPEVGVAPVRGGGHGRRGGARRGGDGGQEGEGDGGEGVQGGAVVRAVPARGQAVHGQRREDAGRGGPDRRAVQPVRAPGAL